MAPASSMATSAEPANAGACASRCSIGAGGAIAKASAAGARPLTLRVLGGRPTVGPDLRWAIHFWRGRARSPALWQWLLRAAPHFGHRPSLLASPRRATGAPSTTQAAGGGGAPCSNMRLPPNSAPARQLRVSISFQPRQMASAQGWRRVRAFTGGPPALADMRGASVRRVGRRTPARSRTATARRGRTPPARRNTPHRQNSDHSARSRRRGAPA